MRLQTEMAKLQARKARIEKRLVRAGEFASPGRAYLTRRVALLVARYYDLEQRIAAKAGTA